MLFEIIFPVTPNYSCDVEFEQKRIIIEGNSFPSKEQLKQLITEKFSADTQLAPEYEGIFQSLTKDILHDIDTMDRYSTLRSEGLVGYSCNCDLAGKKRSIRFNLLEPIKFE